MVESIKSSKIDVFYVHSTKITSHKPLFYGKFYVVVKWSYEGEQNFAFWVQKIHQQISISLMFLMF